MKAFQPVVVGSFIRSVHSEKGHYHLTWHPTSSIVKIYADGNEIFFFTEDSDNAIPYCVARLINPSAAKRTLYDLLLVLSNKEEAAQ